MLRDAFAISFCLIYQSVLAQEEKSKAAFNFGLGFGIDYGGVGTKISLISFTPNFELDGGLVITLQVLAGMPDYYFAVHPKRL